MTNLEDPIQAKWNHLAYWHPIIFGCSGRRGGGHGTSVSELWAKVYGPSGIARNHQMSLEEEPSAEELAKTQGMRNV